MRADSGPGPEDLKQIGIGRILRDFIGASARTKQLRKFCIWGSGAGNRAPGGRPPPEEIERLKLSLYHTPACLSIGKTTQKISCTFVQLIQSAL